MAARVKARVSVSIDIDVDVDVDVDDHESVEVVVREAVIRAIQGELGCPDLTVTLAEPVRG